MAEDAITELPEQGVSTWVDRPLTRKAGRAAREAIRVISRVPYSRRDDSIPDRVDARHQRALDRHFDKTQRQTITIAQVYRAEDPEPAVGGDLAQPGLLSSYDGDSRDLSLDRSSLGSRSSSFNWGRHRFI